MLRILLTASSAFTAASQVAKGSWTKAVNASQNMKLGSPDEKG
jgi:hypothetical protein